MKSRLFVVKTGTEMMGVKVFVDTNVLLRAYFDSFTEHARIRHFIDQLVEADSELWISRQVIREYLVQVLHPRTFTQPPSFTLIAAQLKEIEALYQVANENRETTEKLFDLLTRYPTQGKLVHDANIVATMLVNEVYRLVTLNTSDFKRYENIIQLIEIPPLS